MQLRMDGGAVDKFNVIIISCQPQTAQSHCRLHLTPVEPHCFVSIVNAQINISSILGKIFYVP